MIPRTNPVERFLMKIQKDAGGCHLWQSTMHRDGYGKFWYMGETAKAHKISYILFKGEIPKGMCVLHKCDVRNCVNPDHLFLGTIQDNIKDMDAKGRRVTRAKISREQVQKIKACLSGGLTQQVVANMYGVHQTVVSRIKRGVTASYI